MPNKYATHPSTLLFTNPKMGSSFSTSAAVAADDRSSAVVAFHSNATWDAYWKSHGNSDKLMVIDFSASWCGPCRFIEPAFHALSIKHENAIFVKIDVGELPEVSALWQVQAMPTFVLLKGGKEVGRVVGAKKDELESKVLKFI